MPPPPVGTFASVPSDTSSAMVSTVAPTTSLPRRDEKYKGSDDSWKLPVIVVSTVVGPILVAVIIVLAVLLARTKKKKKSLLNALSQNTIDNNRSDEPRVIEMDDMADREPRPETPPPRRFVNDDILEPPRLNFPNPRDILRYGTYINDDHIFTPITPLPPHLRSPMPMASLSVPPQPRSSSPMTSPPSGFFPQDEEDAAVVQTEHRVQAEQPTRGIPRSHMMARLPRIDTTQFTNLSPIRAIRRMLPATPKRQSGRGQEQDELVVPSTSVTEAGPSNLPAASSASTVTKRKFDEVDRSDGGQDNGETPDQGPASEVSGRRRILYFGAMKRLSKITPFTALNSHRVFTGQAAIDKQAEDEATDQEERAKKLQKKSSEDVTGENGDGEQSDRKGKKVDRGPGTFERLPALPSTPSVMAMTPAPLNIVKRHSYKDGPSNVAGVEKKNIVRRAFTMIADKSPIASLLQSRSEFDTQPNMSPILAPVLSHAQEVSSVDNAGEGPSRQAEVEAQAETSSQPTRPSTPTQASIATMELDETPDYRAMARQRLSGRDPVSPRPVGGIFDGPEFAYLHRAIALRDNEQLGDSTIGFPFDNDVTTSTIFGGDGNDNDMNNEESPVDANATTAQDDAAADENNVENEDTTAENAGIDNDADSESEYLRSLPPVTDMIQPVRHAVSASSTNVNSRRVSDISAPAIPARSPARPQSYVQQRFGGRPQSGAQQQQPLSPQFRRVSAPVIVRGGAGIAVPPAAATRGLGYSHASIASSTRTSMTVTPATARPALSHAAPPFITPAVTTTGLTPSSSMGSTGSILTESPSVDSWLENLVPVTTMGAAGAFGGPSSAPPASPSSASGPIPVLPDHPVTNRDGTVVHNFTFRMPPALPTVGDGLGDALLSEVVDPDLVRQSRPSPPNSVPDIAPSSFTPTSSPPASLYASSPRENVTNAAASSVTGTTATDNNKNNNNSSSSNNEDKKEVKEGDVRSKVREFESKAQGNSSGDKTRERENEQMQSEQTQNEQTEDEQMENETEESNKRESKPVVKPEGNWI